MKKHLINILMLCLVSLMACNHKAKVETGNQKEQTPYTLPKPQGWGVEEFPIPISFAPQITYNGIEDVRFAPGWDNPKTDEFWTYAFLWYLEGNPPIDTTIIQNNLKAYYTGLIGSNITKRKIPLNKVIPTETIIKKTITTTGDLETFKGTILMLDYMEQKPITLNCIIHLKRCEGQNRTCLFHEISPKPMTNAVWENLDQLWLDFNCNKGQNQ
jgi:hypothetical protein